MSTILLVEDDNTSRELLVHRLVNCGYQVLQAACGKDAQEMILCCLPDLILLDITLPDINGLKILENLKSNTKTSAIPVIIVSGRDSNDDVIQGLNMGASDYITKPYQWGIIIARVKSALRSVETTKLLKEALYQERLNVQSKSDFLVNMSHEIRTPLNGILGLLQLMNQTELTDDQRQYTKLMNTSGDALMHIVNNLLDLSRAEAGLLELDNGAFNLEELVKGVSEIIYSKACQKGLEIFIHVDEGVKLDVVGDSNRISQILTNYAANALKFTESGCITFHIKANEGTDKSCCYKLIVEDTGIGLSHEAQKRLFQKFIQADSSIANEYGGSGLGLSICKQLAEVMGGHVGMSSEEGKGTQFWLELPLTFGPEEEKVCSTSLKGKKALIIGTSYFCVNYNEILAGWGAEVTTSTEVPEKEVRHPSHDLYVTNDEKTARDLFDAADKLIYISQGIMENSLTCDATQLQEPLRPSVFHKNVNRILGLD
ncbi:MAG: ATP-binding protein [Lentisphaeraceae bacterium]|nr:ATP-binding protein [Lentisphaeraceae bacterium]